VPPASVKLSPPRVPPWYVPRPELERRLDDAVSYRLTLVVAGAGYGKSTHLAARAVANGWAWYTVDARDRLPATLAQGLASALSATAGELAVSFGEAGDDAAVADSVAAGIAAALDDVAVDDLVVVVDDVHELGRDSAAGAVLEGLVRYAPPGFHLVLCSRDEPPFRVSRLRGQGQVLDVGVTDLAFTGEEVRAFIAARLDTGVDEIAGPLHMVSGGWPAAVQLAADVLQSTTPDARAHVVESLAARRGPLFAYLAEEVFGREPAEVHEILADVAELGSATPELLQALGREGAADTLAALARRGLVVAPPPGSSAGYTLHALVREFAQTNWGASPARSRELHRRASEWFESQGRAAEALDAAIAAGNGVVVARLLSLHARELNELGLTDLVIRASAVVSNELRLKTSTGAVSHAFILRGDLDRAEEWLSLYEQRTDETPGIVGEIAVQRSLVHINRGDSAGALAALETAGPEPGAFIEAFMSYQLLTLGREDEAARLAALALEHAEAEDRPSYAEALMASAEVDRARGDLASAEERFRAAAAVAEQIGNVLASCSAGRRLATVHAERGQLDLALAEMSAALEQADRTGVFEFQGSTRAGRGSVHFALGRLDEAEEDFLSSVEVYERLASAWMAAPLIGLGDVHRERGESAQARSAYERALGVSEREAHIGHEVAAAAGLARVVVDADPDEAEALLTRARSKATPRYELLLALAEGWVALAAGDRERAGRMAAAAVREATRQGTPARTAEALELRCFAASEPRFETDSLQEALAIWRRIGASLAEARALLGLVSLGEDIAEAELADARRTLQHAGVRLPGIGAGISAMIALDRPPPLQIETLGRFAVLRDGMPVPSSEWQSKKARDLLKLLVSRRGKTAPREFLIEALWPDEDPKKTSNRLSVALNVVRGVLDPEGRSDPDRFVAADRDGIRLELENVAVDLERFFEQAEAGLRAFSDDGGEAAQPQLEAAEAAHHGEFLEEERYEDWATPLRDEARSTYLDVARALALAGPDTTRYHLRILALDPYDEDTHLDLVSRLAVGGRHGEARRAYRRYVQRMAEIGVEPAGFPDRTAGATELSSP
jgi:ATP/maltotriose-dependent transcriptional regulator MalT/DNA-binding SARP family transcriptional activator